MDLMETIKHPDSHVVLSPHPITDALIKSLDFKSANYQVIKLDDKNLKEFSNVVALVVKASWLNKNDKLIKKFFVQIPQVALVVLLDQKLAKNEFGFVFLPIEVTSKKISKENKKLIHAFLGQWGKKSQIDKVKNEVELDSFSKPFLIHLLEKFKAKNAFLMISETEPGAKGFVSLGHDLYFRAANPCDFETTLKKISQTNAGKNLFCLHKLDTSGLRGYKVWIGLEFSEPQKINATDIAFVFAPIKDHFVNVIALYEAQSNNMIDDLTNLYNQRYLITVLDREISRSKRQKTSFSVIFLDIDYFKMVNDTKGHWIGSRVLSELGGALKNLVRNSDYCFRYGGDEFVVVLVGTDQDQAGLTAERIRKNIEETEFQVDLSKRRW